MQKSWKPYYFSGWLENWAYLCGGTKDNLGRTWAHEVSKPYKLPVQNEE